MSDMAPYRHVEIERVVECESCSRIRVRSERRWAITKAASKGIGGAVFVSGPWLYALWRAAAWTVMAHPTAPAWAVMLLLVEVFATAGLIVATVKRAKKTTRAA